MEKYLIHLGKLMSLVLRHKPEAIGLVLDSEGWASVDELIEKISTTGMSVSKEDILRVVNENDKKRFSLSFDGERIRANQGHSIPVELGLLPRQPPLILYHGTATRFLNAILTEGLKPQSRQYVHLSIDEAAAIRVGQRHGKPVVLTVSAENMYQRGFQFFLSDNGIWLTSEVPAAFLSVV